MCVPFAHEGVQECTTYHYFASAFFFLWKSGPNKQRAARISNHTSRPACSCIANVYLPKTSGSRCRPSKVVLQRRGVFTHVIIALTPLPHAGPFVIQTKEGPMQILRRFTTHLLRVKWLTLGSSQGTLLPWRSHVSHWEQFTSIATYFRKPLIWTRDEVTLPFFFFSSLIFSFLTKKIIKHPEMICSSKNSCDFYSA